MRRSFKKTLAVSLGCAMLAFSVCSHATYVLKVRNMLPKEGTAELSSKIDTHVIYQYGGVKLKTELPKEINPTDDTITLSFSTESEGKIQIAFVRWEKGRAWDDNMCKITIDKRAGRGAEGRVENLGHMICSFSNEDEHGHLTIAHLQAPKK